MDRAHDVTDTDPDDPGGGRRARRGRLGMVVYGVVATLVIGAGVAASVARGGVTADIRSNATLIAPAAAGGGWDTFMREAQESMRENGLGSNIQVVNVPGAAGTIGLTRLSTMTGRPDAAMVGGTGLVAGVEQTGSQVRMDDVTPIARVVEEYDVVVVPANSPYQNLQQLIDAWREDPAEIAFTGGGSFDELVMAQLASAAGIEPAETTYIPKSGGGEVTQALVTGTADAATSGYLDVDDQIEAGRLRPLALAAKEPIDGLDVPTLPELGYDVTLANWRGVFAPPGISDEQAEVIREVFQEVTTTSEWQDAVARNEWNEVWLDGAEFRRFLDEQEELVKSLYKELGR
ncbi:Bug family tripartite tricarboxylate transporter substrate binding protein [Prauserella alba]|uniref:Tripartite tricarboxylate transporter substrate binding protein TctC n=1 Tax=Prauserella alba TaxID=176898 RepID=A0ABN1VIR6_9PSEU|nr:tripartite tricarboxylate transporter substrate-binding protein [Prauserella alba]MCP2181963.1 putative tricarboxylic transport membrane protein [Prauserella alba]